MCLYVGMYSRVQMPRGSPRAGVAEEGTAQDGCWEPDSSLLEDQKVPLTTEPSLLTL